MSDGLSWRGFTGGRLAEFLRERSEHRVGHFFENLVHFWLKHVRGVEMVAHRQSVRNGQRPGCANCIRLIWKPFGCIGRTWLLSRNRNCGGRRVTKESPRSFLYWLRQDQPPIRDQCNSLI